MCDAIDAISLCERSPAAMLWNMTRSRFFHSFSRSNILCSGPKGRYHIVTALHVASRADQFCHYLFDVPRLIITLKKDVPGLELVLRHPPIPPIHVGDAGWRDDEGVEDDIRVTELPFEVLDRDVESDL